MYSGPPLFPLGVGVYLHTMWAVKPALQKQRQNPETPQSRKNAILIEHPHQLLTTFTKYLSFCYFKSIFYTLADTAGTENVH